MLLQVGLDLKQVTSNRIGHRVRPIIGPQLVDCLVSNPPRDGHGMRRLVC